MLRQYRFALTGWLVGVTCHAICPSWATANAPAIRLAPVVRKLLDDPATDASRRRHLAIFHGQWDQISDLTPAERARIALGKYQLHDESLQNGLAAPHASAVAALRRGDPQRVLDLLDLIKEPKTARTAVLRAQALDMTGNRSEALTTLLPWREKLERESFDDAEQLTAAARGLVMLAAYEGRPAHDYHTAMRFFAKAHSELDRLYWPAHLAEAELLVAKHNSKEAASALSLALELNPHSSRAWYLLGLIGLKQFDFAQAIACEQRLRQINPRHLLADLLQVQIRLTQADPQTAAVALTPALTAHPKHRLLIALKAATDALRYNEADLKATISRFESLWPGGAMVYHTVGTYLTMARQYDSAAQMFRLAIERDPNWPDPRSELGLILLQAGREQEAQKELAVAVDLDPFHTRAANSMKLVKHLLAYEQIATKHFVIKYHKGIDQVLAR
ncbi:MAG: tetratricopeptide repeat protein, partial [Pirellulaceae bacterium]|nr:tetratricopeptide repeat protein [Pirellulaceae bacterium]